MLLCCVLVDRRIGKGGAVATEVLCLPDEVLEKVALVLGE
jgi:hypothetical protein